MDNFYGNADVVETLEQYDSGRLHHTDSCCYPCPEGGRQGTLARRFAAELLDEAHRNSQHDDLSLESNADLITDREKWTSDKRNDDPLVFFFALPIS